MHLLDIASEHDAAFERTDASAPVTDLTVIRRSIRRASWETRAAPLNLHAVIAGEAMCAMGRREFKVRPRTSLLSLQQERSQFTTMGDGVTTILSVHYPVTVFQDMQAESASQWDVALAGERNHTAIRPASQLLRPSNRLAQRLQRLAEVKCATDCQNISLEILSDLTDALIDAQKGMERIPAARASVRAELFRRASIARDTLESYPETRWTMEALGREACLSPFHLHRTFRSAFGITPMNFLRARRIEYASELLSASSVAIGEVALRVGFENFSAFSRSFRELTGLSPSAYRSKIA